MDRAHWIYYYEDGVKHCKCSECATSYGCFDTPYCPNCGEKMVATAEMLIRIAGEERKGET